MEFLKECETWRKKSLLVTILGLSTYKDEKVVDTSSARNRKIVRTCIATNKKMGGHK